VSPGHARYIVTDGKALEAANEHFRVRYCIPLTCQHDVFGMRVRGG